MNLNSFPWITMQRSEYGLRTFNKDLRLHVLGWRALDRLDSWGRRVLDFKEDTPRAVQGAKEVMGRAFPGLMSKLNIDHCSVGLVTALSHDDTKTNDTKPLSVLAKSLSEQSPRLKWWPDALQKEKHTRTTSDGRKKDQEIQGKYQCMKLPDGASSIIVLDDFVTRGATFSEIARAIKVQNSSMDIHFVALAKHIRLSHHPEIDNKHIEKWFPDIEEIWPVE